ncbi:MAG TPA: hypothetical protein VE465_02115 [Streptosporangiaceae bacterium]|jgi:hypothetical protein|nr:hypothetical protein [Streptosporangiaceae bacterium]
MEALGRLFDLSTGWVPVDAQAAQTGKRVSLRNAGGCTIVVFKAAGTAGDDHSYDLQQHTASSGGTTADLDIVDHYYLKAEATLDGDETWAKHTQSAASEITEAGGAGTSAEEQQILVIEVDADQLSDGYSYISLNSGGEGSNAQLSGCLYILHDLHVQRTPANLAAPLS